MNINSWLDAGKGRGAELAAHLQITPSAVSQWRQNGVPTRLMKKVQAFTAGAVTLDEMIPDAIDQHGVGRAE